MEGIVLETFGNVLKGLNIDAEGWLHNVISGDESVHMYPAGEAAQDTSDVACDTTRIDAQTPGLEKGCKNGGEKLAEMLAQSKGSHFNDTDPLHKS